MLIRILNRSLRHSSFVRCMSTEVVPKTKYAVALRTSASPLEQTEEHGGHFYNIPDEDLNNVLPFSLPHGYKKNIPTFGEASIMVRPHTVELLNYLRNADYSNPVIRYVLYGKPGSGKSITVSHILHYAYLSNFIVLHVPWVWNWYRRNRTEVATSDTREGLYNLPVEAANWLKCFQKQNEKALASYNIRLSKEYVWSQREATPANAPLQELVTHGISRIRYACDVIDVLVNELKLHSSEGRCKTLIAIDGFNQFFLPFSNIRNAERKKVIPDQVSLAQTFMSAVKADWTNGAVIVTVDQLNTRDNDASEKPLYLLKKRGFELLDPFIPIEVPQLSESEFHSMLDYYEDRRWLSKEVAREELDFISQRNAFYLMNLCTPL